MKVYISADMEGISGVVNWKATGEEGMDYTRARKLMTQEVNAAIEGAIRAGAKEIIVNDSHNTMNNILIEDLNPAAQLIMGTPKMYSMMEGVDETFDGVFFVGYHSRMHTNGVLNHTYSSRTVACLRINGREVGEFGLNSYIAGYYNVPVLMVSGDDQLAREARELIYGITTVTVKEARGRYSATCLNPNKARALIEEGAYQALKNRDSVKPLKAEQPVLLEVVLADSGMADAAQIMPGVRRTGPNSLEYAAAEILTAYRAFRTITTLAFSVTI